VCVRSPVGAGTVGGAGVIAATAIIRMLGPAAIAVTAFLRRFATGTRIRWAQIPRPIQIVLASIGIGVGTDILMDIPGVPGEGRILPFGGDGLDIPGHADIEGVHLGAHVIGSWVANGVTFYRLSDGKLAVRNKKGRWKVWRPKRPIVLYSDGAKDMKTMLRADAALQRQAKKIATMLNRRTKPRASRKKSDGHENVLVIDGKSAHPI